MSLTNRRFEIILAFTSNFVKLRLMPNCGSGRMPAICDTVTSVPALLFVSRHEGILGTRWLPDALRRTQKNRIKGEVDSVRKSNRFGAILLVLVMMTAFIPALPTAAAADDDWTFWVYGGRSIITKYIGNVGGVTIPDVLGGAPVTQIDENTFDPSPITMPVFK